MININPTKDNILVMYSTDTPTKKHIQNLSKIASEYNIINVKTEQEAIANAPNTKVILGHRYLKQVLPYAKKLKWVQSSAKGIDHLLTKNLYSIKPILTSTPIFADIIAFHAISLAFSLIRRCATNISQLYPEGIPQKVMIIGTGQIGKKIAKFLHNFHCNIIGVNTGKELQIDYFNNIICYNKDWKSYINSVDVLFICLPDKSNTKKIIDNTVISKLKDNSTLVNVGRGATVNHKSLLDNVKNGRIFAGLDVIDNVDEKIIDRLIKLPNVIITPKSATLHPKRQEKFEQYVEEQLKKYILNRTLRSIYEY